MSFPSPLELKISYVLPNTNDIVLSYYFTVHPERAVFCIRCHRPHPRLGHKSQVVSAKVLASFISISGPLTARWGLSALSPLTLYLFGSTLFMTRQFMRINVVFTIYFVFRAARVSRVRRFSNRLACKRSM